MKPLLQWVERKGGCEKSRMRKGGSVCIEWYKWEAGLALYVPHGELYLLLSSRSKN